MEVYHACCAEYEDQYEEIDGRRSSTLETWLRMNLTVIRKRAPGGSLLDIGTGSGLVTRCARGLFVLRVGIDLSSRILVANRNAFDFGVTADVGGLPLPDKSFDVINSARFSIIVKGSNYDRMLEQIQLFNDPTD